MDWPKITVVTPSYNQGQFLEATIRSVLDQNYPNLEYMVIDGGSTDNSVEIIRRHSEHIAYWVSERDGGQAQAINKGITRATGDVFAWLNSDDTYEPCTLSRIGKIFATAQPPDAVCGRCRLMSADGLPGEELTFIKEPTFETLLSVHCIAQPSTFVRADAWRTIGTLDERMHFSFDYDFWVRLHMAGFRITGETEVLSNYRLHELSKTCQSRPKFDAEIVAVNEKLLRIDRRRSTQKAVSRCYLRFANEYLFWYRDPINAFRNIGKALRTDFRTFDAHAAKLFLQCICRMIKQN